MQVDSSLAPLAQLRQQAEVFQAVHLKDLFAQHAERFSQFNLGVGPILFDYSKQRVTQDILDLLSQFAESAGLKQWIDRLFQGDTVNNTENRAALHWALRVPESGDALTGLNQDILQGIHKQIDHMGFLVEQLHQGQYRGCTGEVITDVVNIGVGGSDLGPLMVSRALEDYKIETPQNLQLHFVSSMDGSQVSQVLHTLRPETTLFVISSKSFTTVDTLYNAETAKSWLERKLGSDARVSRCHFVGVSANQEKMAEWGICAEHQLGMGEWVGGRFSLWSTIGFPIALTIGIDGFKKLLAGAHFMDQHFQHAPWLKNMPVLMALIGIWNTNFLNIKTQAILPYDGRLEHLADYLQQLEMESNGKSVTRDGTRVKLGTCPIIWGNVGPNAQHAFYQLLHQGTEPITCDFIAPALRYHAREAQHAEAASELQAQHQLALANCLAQSRLLALGEAALDERYGKLPAYKRYYGNQSSSTILLNELNPFSLGALLAAYEHKVFVQSIIWGINPFDQWGVEMGKEIAKELLPALQGESAAKQFDSSTEGLLKFILN
ncbi:glucose-6-phosphate isomerase [Alkanindiges sp. WGS2144]|uniref:glucose-6-phosphate isomerase n=1 Tax=Alkanindiges sp. WGS2144 TaxID=3366808 RepID=UPI003753DE66